MASDGPEQRYLDQREQADIDAERAEALEQDQADAWGDWLLDHEKELGKAQQHFIERVMT